MILGILEFGVFLLLVASLLRLEFLPHREKWFLQFGLAVALLTFACLAFGQTGTNQTPAPPRCTPTSARRW